MKISSLLKENDNYTSQLRSDINAYPIRLKANGIESIDTDVMVKELTDLGYSITPESLVDFIKNNKYTKTVTVDTIELHSTPATQGPEASDANRAAVKKLAQKATSKRM